MNYEQEENLTLSILELLAVNVISLGMGKSLESLMLNLICIFLSYSSTSKAYKACN